MGSNEEHGAQNPDNPYCVHCTDLKGKLLPFEKKFEDMVSTAMSTRWMNHEEAERFVLSEMLKMPAWHNQVEQMIQRSLKT
jgi:hypothetical protein